MVQGVVYGIVSVYCEQDGDLDGGVVGSELQDVSRAYYSLGYFSGQYCFLQEEVYEYDDYLGDDV